MRQANKDKGAVLLTTLLVMSIMAAIAVVILDDVRFAVKRASNMQAYAQADWYRQAAEDFSKIYVELFVNNSEEPALNQSLTQAEPRVFPIEGGSMVFEARDGSQCIAISAMTSESASEPQFIRRLMVNLGWPQNEAAIITAQMIDWQDADTQVLPGGAEDYTYLDDKPAYRTAGVPFDSVMEIRALDAMDETQYQAIRPFICAGQGRQTRINVNTLQPWQAPVLAAILGDNQLEAALQLIESRPGSGYDEASFNASPIWGEDGLPAVAKDALVFEPKYIWVEADILFGEAERSSVFEFEIDSSRAKRTYRRHTAEAKRPILRRPDPE